MPPPTPRTTSTLVEGLVQVQAGIDLAPFIATANEIISEICGNSSYTDGYIGSRMELLERWYAAHLYTINDNQLAAAKAGTVSVAYQYKVDYGLKNSMYGQQVMILDTKGNLAKLQNTVQVQRKIKCDITWLGTKRRFKGGLNSGDCADADLTVEQ